MATGGLWIAGIPIAGWIAYHFIGKPYLEYRQLRAEIARCLVLYANVPLVHEATGSLDPSTIKARDRYRELACDLAACAEMIPLYEMWSLIRILPKRYELDHARGNLIGLSNSLGELNQAEEISIRVANIRRILGIKDHGWKGGRHGTKR